MHDLIIKNCTIVDGSGSDLFSADIAIKDGKFSRVAPGIRDEAAKTLDAKGKTATPGFIDIHRHEDAFVFRPDFGEVQLRQGITTTINGNCGLSIAPCPPKWREDILQYLKPIVGSLPEGIAFDSVSEYIAAVEKQKLPINFGMHVGDGALRMAAKGFAAGKLSSAEVATVHRYLEDAMASGIFGVSMGIVYQPESYYDVPGFIEALAPMKGKGIPIVTHIRGEGTLLVESLKEVISVAKGLDIPLHVSHYKCVGARNWGHLLRQATDLLEKEMAGGMSITVDVYPWGAGSTQLTQVLPPEFLEGGMAETTKRLKDPAERKRCIEVLTHPQDAFENQVELLGWENIMIGSVKTDKNRDCEGKRISEIAAMRGADPYETALTLLAEEDCEVSMINFIACDEDIETIMKLPYSYIISDSIYPDRGKPHPRQYGTFTKVLSEYVRDRKVLPLARAVNKFTHAPAARFGIRNKGLIREGYDADLAVFDLASIANHATYLDPRRLGTGFAWVLVNGRTANENDVFINNDAGRVVRRQ
jgi:N-acyl-D-aspartate/D-glutamate deacylase